MELNSWMRQMRSGRWQRGAKDPPWKPGTRMRSALSRSHSFLVPFYRATFDSRRSICTNSAKMIFLWWSPLFLRRRKNRKIGNEGRGQGEEGSGWSGIRFAN